MINKGNHPAAVVPVSTEHGDVACQIGYSSKKGTPQIAVCLEILRGPCAGQRLTWIGFFTEKTEERTLGALRLCGFAGDDIDKFAEQRPTNEVIAVVEHEVDQKGVTRAKVAWINDPTFGGMKMANALAGSELRKFGAQFKSKLKTIPAVKTIEAKREAPSDAPSAGDDWSGNDQLPPPADNEPGAPLSDDNIPF